MASSRDWDAGRLPLGAEAALAFGAGAASFAFVAVTLAVTDSDVLVVVLGDPWRGAGRRNSSSWPRR